MPFTCNRHETRLLLEGRAVGAVRYYGEHCPHEVGAELWLSSMFLPGEEGNDVPFAKATVVSVRPGTVGEFRQNDEIAQMDGYANAVAWHTYFSQFMFPGLGDGDRVFHLQLRIEELNKKPEMPDR